MNETSIYSFYSFGYNYYIWRKDWNSRTVSKSIEVLAEYLSNISQLEVQVTAHITNALYTKLEELHALKPDDLTPKEIAEKIEDTINIADKTLDAELELKKVLQVTPKRFDINMLLKSPDKLLACDAWKKLPENARKDFSEAAKCIAMHLPTAAAFHLMRSVEECVKLLYFEFVKQKRMDKPMWGPMLIKLKDKNHPKPSTELIEHLDIIRKNFRNPTQHPEKFYTIDDVQDLMNNSIVAINGIIKEIK